MGGIVTRARLAELREQMKAKCPVCKAAPGVVCKTRNGQNAKPLHGRRVKLSEAMK